MFCFISCVRNEQIEGVSFEGISEPTQSKMKHYYDSLLNSNEVFKRIVDELLKERKGIKISLSRKVELGGMNWKKNGEIFLVFSSTDEFMTENMIIEEFFHAFQFQFYGKSRFTKNETGKIIGASNIEYEAKLFKAILNAYQGKPFNETPSQKGLVEFVLSLLNDKGELSGFRLTPEQHIKYINLIKHFQQHWETRNKNENKRNFYDHPVDEGLSPDACFYILAQ